MESNKGATNGYCWGLTLDGVLNLFSYIILWGKNQNKYKN